MLEVEIDYETLGRARDKAAAMGKLKGSFTNGDGNIAGFLGELMFEKHLQGFASHKESFDYDYVLNNGETVDVKTKRTSVKPLPHYECSVSGLNVTQKCDYYAFARVKTDFSVGWLIGYMPKKEFFNQATLYKKGTKDPSNKFVCKVDTYSMPHSSLLPFEDFMK
jgi:hypothetical protein